jgi:hypothetical protein
MIIIISKLHLQFIVATVVGQHAMQYCEAACVQLLHA